MQELIKPIIQFEELNLVYCNHFQGELGQHEKNTYPQKSKTEGVEIAPTNIEQDQIIKSL